MQKAILRLFTAMLVFSLAQPVFAQSIGKRKTGSPGDKIRWYSFEEAYVLNKKKQKKIFIDVYTNWCGWCKKMDAETFENPVIRKYMAKNFICVKLNAERKDTVVIDGVTFTNPDPYGRKSSHQLAVDLLKGKMSYPSCVFLNEKGQWLTVIPGYHGAKEFEPILHYFGENAYQDTPWEDFRTAFSGDIR